MAVGFGLSRVLRELDPASSLTTYGILTIVILINDYLLFRFFRDREPPSLLLHLDRDDGFGRQHLMVVRRGHNLDLVLAGRKIGEGPLESLLILPIEVDMGMMSLHTFRQLVLEIEEAPSTVAPSAGAVIVTFDPSSSPANTADATPLTANTPPNTIAHIVPRIIILPPVDVVDGIATVVRKEDDAIKCSIPEHRSASQTARPSPRWSPRRPPATRCVR